MTISNNKLLIGASGGGSDPINVEDVFSVFLYEGNGGTQTFNNGIDIDGEGGLVWIKNRDADDNHILTDTVRGATKILNSNEKTPEATDADTLTAFNSTGFAIGDDIKVNTNNESYVAWTFRKNPKFFDVVTYTGTGSAQNISHNLDAAVGMLMVKERGGDENWKVWHRGFDADQDYYLTLNDSGSVTLDNYNRFFTSTNPTSSVFTVGTDNATNGSSKTYVAYLFAHNDGDGEFGPDGDQDIIKCGTFTGGSGTYPNDPIELGFEPHWLLYKRISGAENFRIVDSMRGWGAAERDNHLKPDINNRKDVGAGLIDLTNTGFHIRESQSGTYIYMAIGPRSTSAITNASDVFAIDTRGSTGDGLAPAFRSTSTVDFALRKSTSSGNWEVLSRKMWGSSLKLNLSNPEDTGSGADTFDFNTGYNYATNTTSSQYSWMWTKAKSFCDVVLYKGTGGNRTVKHALGVVPEMIWVKDIQNNVNWWVFGGDETNVIGSTNSTQEDFDSNTYWNDTAPTASVFSLGTNSQVNGNNVNFIAFLFATLAGVSKVGTIAHSGSSTDVDCGFANGSKAVLLKRKDAAADWLWFDSVRGIVADEDPYFRFNTNGTHENSQDYIDPLASGFQISGNFDDGTYLFYAIAA